VAPGGGIGPHRRVVHAGEVGGEVDLALGGHAAYRLAGRPRPRRSRSEPGP
jgi:hypothetical protein